MRFALCSGVSYFGTYLAHNFLNNRCSMTILCNKQQKICGKLRLSSVIVKRRFSIIRVHRCGTSGSMRASQAAGLGSIPGRDKFRKWGFSGFFLTLETNVRNLFLCLFIYYLSYIYKIVPLKLKLFASYGSHC